MTGLVLCDVPPGPADHHRQLCLPIDLVDTGGNPDGLSLEAIRQVDHFANMIGDAGAVVSDSEA